jgi:uncharacterized protein (TIGR00725 family)
MSNKQVGDVFPHFHRQYKLCVSGAAETGLCAPDAFEKAKELGHEIVKHGAILTSGATTGFPYWVAIGVKEAGGMSIGLSPAASELEHVKKYKLPIDYFDLIVYTGFGYSGRNLMLTRASDAVLIGCGRMGTLNEFTIAFEDHKPIGVLLGTGGTTDMIQDIVKTSHRNSVIAYSTSPKEIVEKTIALIEKEKVPVNA